VLQQMLGDGASVRRVIAACYASAIVPLMVAAYQAFTAGGSSPEGVSRVRGTFAHPNALGFYLVILTVMGIALLPHLTRNVRPLLLLLLWGSILVVVLTYSRGSWFALLLGSIALSVPPITARLSDLGEGPSTAGVRGNSLQWRFDYWNTVLALSNDSPIIGIGPKMTQYATDEAKVPHNDFLRAYVEMGVLGLTAYAVVVLTLIYTARRAIRRAAAGFDRGVAVGFAGCVTALILFSVAENLMSQVVVLWYFAAFAAAAIAVSSSTSQAGGRHAFPDPTRGVDDLPPPPPFVPIPIGR
jgi:putative inorganic carbon (HCO3(-)) transporter